ncbi:MAG: hypothetical protein CFE32_14545 [Alphaproteobacteria bacterium PA3]|nr:MAG: hypothetical protein CFE32_14545 [Alphaproteobacteria bacterium PA3]
MYVVSYASRHFRFGPAPSFALLTLEPSDNSSCASLGGQGARCARRSRFHPLTPHLALSNSKTAFASAQPAAKAFQVKSSKQDPLRLTAAQTLENSANF